MTDMRTKQIDVTKETREFLMKAFNCTSVSLWRALKYENNTPLSLRIRKLAKERGGVELTTAPTDETIHDCNGFMRQYFMNGAMIEVDKNNGHLDVYDKDGKLRQELNNCTIAQLYVMQEFANRL